MNPVFVGAKSFVAYVSSGLPVAALEIGKNFPVPLRPPFATLAP
jgi:hypothetical protein